MYQDFLLISPLINNYFLISKHIIIIIIIMYIQHVKLTEHHYNCDKTIIIINYSENFFFFYNCRCVHTLHCNCLSTVIYNS